MANPQAFRKLDKLPKVGFGDFCHFEKIKIDAKFGIDPAAPLTYGLEILYNNNAKMEFLQVLCSALPARERVWYACLACRDMLPKDAPKTAVLQAAEAWVYKPNIKTRKAVEQALKDADGDDPTVMAGDAAFHGIVPGLEDEVKSPPNACAAMAFGAVLQSLYSRSSEAAQKEKWQLLAARGLNIASGGSGAI